MKHFKSIDVIAFTYTLYFSITLALEPNIFDQSEALYTFLERITPYEMVWGMGALTISIIYGASFLFKNYKWLSVVASILGGLFFILIGSAYMLTYPNIGSGIFTIIGIVCFMNIGSITITHDEMKNDIK